MIVERVRIDVVPCGRCHECLAKQQNEFAALAVLEAKRSKSMYMAAFTYDNAHCPIMKTEKNELGEFVFRGFVHGQERYRVMPDMLRERFDRYGKLIKYLVSYDPVPGVSYQPSLQREDVRLFLKKTRQSFKRKYGYYPQFRYAAFGEYGDEFHRPHTHFLFFDMSPLEIGYFKDAWSRSFGYMDVCEIPVLNKDGSPARVKVSKYVAKYLRKPRSDFLPLLNDLCERPRLIVSKNFGSGVLPDSLKSFYLAEDMIGRSKESRFNEILKRKKSLVIDGVKFPMPRKILDQYFREETLSDYKTNINEKTGEIALKAIRKTRRTSLSLQVSRFARDRYFEDALAKFRQSAERNTDLSYRESLLKVCNDESICIEDRAQNARKIYLQHLTKQKYG